MPFGEAVQPGLVNTGNGGSFAQKQPMRPMGQGASMGGVNRPKLGAGGARKTLPAPNTPAPQPLQPAQGLSPSYARTPSTNGLQDVASQMRQQQQPLIQTPPEGPATQGYGQAAKMPDESQAKLQPTGGVQMGARNVVGSMGSMNPNSPIMAAMAARNFGNMGRPGMAFNPATQVERGIGPSNPWQQGMGPILQAYMNKGMNRGQDMSWMKQPGAISPEYMQPKMPPPGGYDMGAVSQPQIMNAPPPPDMNGGISRPAVMPRTPPPEQEMPMQQEQLMNQEQAGIGPSPEMMQQQMPQMKERFTRGRRR